MRAPDRPANEATRLATLRALRILDSAPEERFDRITRLAQRIFGVPMALVTLVDEDRQWFKSRQGIEIAETPRDVSFCGHAILESGLFVVPDAALDVRFADNPLVTGDPRIRFYAGCPLAASDGSLLGTLCILDREPRALDHDDRQVLRDLAATVEGELVALENAACDELTGALNRRGLRLVGDPLLARCRRTREPLTLLVVDLDGLKPINDTHGHAAGDDALKDAGRLLVETVRASDMVARLGGDEFCVLLVDTTLAHVPTLLARLHDRLGGHNAAAGRPYALALSAGAVQFDPSSHATLDDLVRAGDAVMYEDKRRRRATRG